MLPILVTKRCILKEVCLENTKDMYEYAKEEKVVRYMTFPKHESLGNTKNLIESFFIERYKQGISYDYGITYKENNKFIGTSGFCRIENKVATLGYCLNPDYWNKGIMTEVVTRLIKFGFDDLKLEKIEAQFYDGNIKSGNVMKKCGMKYLGSEEREIKLQGKMVMGKIHRCEITKEDYYKG
ncbi:GNAT family N-acetyltransferase [Romboutsia sp. MSSM.1001216sp_RTP31141st1_G3_RTP31141_220114]|uniref:GNAT family N-acetyltransferase n=1 Tax=unclassified Romboutsia TaxID=2626894 RepID=UPI0031B64FE1